MPQACGDIVDLVYFLTDKEKLSFQCYHAMNGVAGDIQLTFADYLPLISLTYVLELPFYFLALRSSVKWPHILFITLIANLATHPFICFAMPRLMENWPYGYYLLSAEIFAPMVEGFILNRVGLSFKRAMIYSFTANFISWNLGTHLFSLYF